MIPFVLFLMLTITNPDYLPMLTESETGRQAIVAGVISGFIGILWIRRIIRIDV
jgi:tight adherence protein B